MNSKVLKVLMVIGIILILFLTVNISVEASSNNKIIFKKAEDEYIIYYESICKDDFQFALSNNKDAKIEELVFIKSVKDKDSDNAEDVAYINSKLYRQFFEENKKAYIWIRSLDEKLRVQAEEIDLKTCIDEELVNFVCDTTKRIDVDTTKTNQTKKDENGVETTITVGKVVLKEKAESNYSYKLVKINDENKKEKEFFELAEKIQKTSDNDTYSFLSLSDSFYKLYNELEPDAGEWKEVKDLEIIQPETTKDGDKYIVWLKETTKDKEIVDAKFLVSIYEYEPKYEKQDKVVTEVVKSPVTYDSPFLIITFIVIIIALIITIKIRLKLGRTHKAKH